MSGANVNRVLTSAADVQLLAERLNECPGVSRLDGKDEPEAWRLAYSLSDLEELFKTVTDDLMPRLVDATLDCAQLEDLLGDIGETFRHAIYHLHEPMYYRYLWPELTAEISELP